MTTVARTLVLVCIALCCGHRAIAQSLAPRAYVITPVNSNDSNAITLTWSFYDGGVNFNGTFPATGTYQVPILSYYHSFRFFGRSANITGFLPYSVGTFQGSLLGTQQQIYRSGLLDFTKGGPAMRVPEFVKWKQKRLLGASLIVQAPRQLGHQSMGIPTGVRLFPALGQLASGCLRRRVVLHHKHRLLLCSQPTAKGTPIGSIESHLSYDFRKLRCWARST